MDEVLEKQADMIRYLQQHNTNLGKRLMKLTAQQERGSLEAWFYLYSAYMKSQGPSARLILDAFVRRNVTPSQTLRGQKENAWGGLICIHTWCFKEWIKNIKYLNVYKIPLIVRISIYQCVWESWLNIKLSNSAILTPSYFIINYIGRVLYGLNWLLYSYFKKNRFINYIV